MIKIPEVIVELKPSKSIEGEVGVFAAKLLPKDSVVFDAEHYDDSEFVTWEEFENLDETTKRKILDYCAGREDGFYLPKDLNLISIGWHMNHSCTPNIGFDEKDNFVAMKDIQPGEELFWDYGYDETNPNFKLKCICKTEKCRGFVTGNDWKVLKDDPIARPYLSSHAKELISNFEN